MGEKINKYSYLKARKNCHESNNCNQCCTDGRRDIAAEDPYPIFRYVMLKFKPIDRIGNIMLKLIC